MALSSAPIVHYEVYVLVNGRWILQLRFRKEEKDAALTEAKELEKSLKTSVKVMRETYYPERNACEEVSVYLTSSRNDSSLRTIDRTPVRQAAAAARRPTQSREVPPPPVKRPREKVDHPFSLLFKLIAIVVIGITAAIFVTTAASTAMGKLGMIGTSVSTEKYPLVMFGVFGVTFLITAVPMAIFFLGGVERPQKRPPAPARPAPDRVVPAPPPPPVDPTPQEDDGPSLLERLLAAATGGSRDEADGAAPPEEAAAPEPDATIEQPPETETEPEAEAEKQPEEPEEPEPPGIERHRVTVMRFLGEVLAVVKETRPQLDSFNRFGVDLIMAGAVEVIGERENLEAAVTRRLLRESVELLGTRPDLAAAFCDRLDEYLLEPRYMGMVQTGRDMMSGHLAGETAAVRGLGAVLEAWNKPTSAQATQRVMAVMFTDMVGSTDMTQDKGDVAAQEIVRRHNAIVRTALSEYEGREIKHTGDGIMASFASVGNAVDASVAIQRQVAAFNAGGPEIQMHLRIGINAGEPIQEEDDLFGSTVQLAARVCAAARSDEILCTNVVRELSLGKGRQFLSRGEQPLKGFKETFTLYEVLWAEGKEPAAEGAPEVEGVSSPS